MRHVNNTTGVTHLYRVLLVVSRTVCTVVSFAYRAEARFWRGSVVGVRLARRSAVTHALPCKIWLGRGPLSSNVQPRHSFQEDQRTIQETIIKSLMNPTMLDLDNFLCAEDQGSGALVGFGQVGLGTLFLYFSCCVALQIMRASADRFLLYGRCTISKRHRSACRHRHINLCRFSILPFSPLSFRLC